MKWTCLEHDVDKSCVDDVLALARVHMAKDEEDDEEEPRSKSWGQRQNGRRKKMSGVEAAFYSKNPGLKDD